MSKNLTNTQKTLLNLHRWRTVEIAGKWYILSDPAKDIIEDAICNGHPKFQQLTLNEASGKNGEPTGNTAKIYVAYIIATLSTVK